MEIGVVLQLNRSVGRRTVCLNSHVRGLQVLNDENYVMPGKDVELTCPLCNDNVVESQYPRHRLILEDESEEAANRREEERLCEECWTTIRAELSVATTSV